MINAQPLIDVSSEAERYATTRAIISVRPKGLVTLLSFGREMFLSGDERILHFCYQDAFV